MCDVGTDCALSVLVGAQSIPFIWTHSRGVTDVVVVVAVKRDYGLVSRVAGSGRNPRHSGNRVLCRSRARKRGCFTQETHNVYDPLSVVEA